MDGLRGVLALSVFIHHARCIRTLCLKGQWSTEGDDIFAQAAIYAVTLFFFITGFIFWTKLQHNPRPPMGKHLSSRVARLVPAYWASLVVILAYIAVNFDWTHWDYGLPLLKNIVSWLLFTLPGLDAEFRGPGISRIHFFTVWTLKMEWLFYLLIPFCGWFALRVWRTGMFIAVFIILRLWAINGLADLPITEGNREGANTATMVFACLFSGGIAVAAVRPWIRARFHGTDFRGFGFSLLGVGLVLAMFFCTTPKYGFIESAWLIGPFLLITLGNDWFGILTSKPMLFLGRISYSIYLIHGILLFLFFHYLVSFYSIGDIPLMVFYLIIAVFGGIVIAISALSYRLFEAPFMKSLRATENIKEREK